MSTRPEPRHFSMIRGFHLADAFTLANAACGVAGVLVAMRYLATRDVGDLLVAAAFAPAALIFDVLHRFIHPVSVALDRTLPRGQIDIRFERAVRLTLRALAQGVA